MVLDFIQTIGRTLGKHDQLGIANKMRRQPITTTLGKLYVVALFISHIVSNESGLIMWLVAGVFGILFMFCGYLLIYNVFEIAVTNDIRQYGLLRTVGTTSQQIKRLVNRQALYLFLIGTPLGRYSRHQR